METQQAIEPNYANVLQHGSSKVIADIVGCTPAYVARIANKPSSFEPKTKIQFRVLEALKITADYYTKLYEVGSTTLSFNHTQIAS